MCYLLIILIFKLQLYNKEEFSVFVHVAFDILFEYVATFVLMYN